VRAIKQVTTLKGRDPREFALMPFGGAGPLHAGSLIREMRMPRAIVPLYPGVLSACGMVSADLEYVHTTSVLERMDRLRSGALEELYQALQAQGLKEMVESGVDAERVHFRRRARARYLRQVRELLVDVAEDAGSPEEALQAAFDDEHEQRFGFSTDDPIEVIDIELSSVCPPDSDIRFDRRPSGSRLQARESRVMLVEGVGKTRVPVFNRDDLPLGETIAGPAVIEQYETNTVVLADQQVQLHESGVLVLDEQKAW
jgi:N-methylhydantoinase A